MKNNLSYDFYQTYEESGKETELKWYICTFLYKNKPDNMKKGMKGVVLYNKKNAYSFRNQVVTAQNIFFHALFLTWMGDRRLWLGMIPPPLR